MPENNSSIFLSAECCRQPLNFYDSLREDCYCYILNGANLHMKSKIINRLEEYLTCEKTEYITVKNPADSGISDGIIIPKIKTAVIVGDERNGVIPSRSPSGDVGIQLDSTPEKGDKDLRDMLERLYREETEQKKKAGRFARVAGELMSDNAQLIRRLSDGDKLSRFALRFAAKNLPQVGVRESGREYPLFLSAVTGSGYIFENSIGSLGAKRLVLLDDPNSAVSPLIISQIKAYALCAGYSVFISYNPIFGIAVPDCVLIKEAGIALGRLKGSFDMPVRRVNCRKFYDNQQIRLHRERIAFNRGAADEMLCEAAKAVQTAADVREEISDLLQKRFYPDSMRRADEVFAELSERIKERISDAKIDIL